MTDPERGTQVGGGSGRGRPRCRHWLRTPTQRRPGTSRGLWAEEDEAATWANRSHWSRRGGGAGGGRGGRGGGGERGGWGGGGVGGPGGGGGGGGDMEERHRQDRTEAVRRLPDQPR